MVSTSDSSEDDTLDDLLGSAPQKEGNSATSSALTLIALGPLINSNSVRVVSKSRASGSSLKDTIDGVLKPDSSDEEESDELDVDGLIRALRNSSAKESIDAAVEESGNESTAGSGDGVYAVVGSSPKGYASAWDAFAKDAYTFDYHIDREAPEAMETVVRSVQAENIEMIDRTREEIYERKASPLPATLAESFYNEPDDRDSLELYKFVNLTEVMFWYDIT